MNEIIALTACLTPLLSRTSLHQMRIIVLALLNMNGRATMLGMSQWAEDGEATERSSGGLKVVSIGAWLYNIVAGIELAPAAPGYKHAILRP